MAFSEKTSKPMADLSKHMYVALLCGYVVVRSYIKNIIEKLKKPGETLQD
jgi:hypothetical protein